MASEKQRKFFAEVTEEHRAEVVDAILETIAGSDGTLDWSRSWDIEAMRPQNPVSGTRYRGMNRLYLARLATRNGYADPRWMTFNQAKKLGCSVRKGSKGAFVEKWGLRTVAARPTDEQMAEIEQGRMSASDLSRSFLALQGVYKVFNGSCIEGLGPIGDAEAEPDGAHEVADRFISLAEADVREVASERAYYSPSLDQVVVPMRGSFETPEAFCATLFHELAHSTGHDSRLARPMSSPFGTPAYAEEELRAELASVLIQAEMGFESFGKRTGEEFRNSCAYLASWARHTAEDDVRQAIAGAVADAAAICDRLTAPYWRSLKEEAGIIVVA